MAFANKLEIRKLRTAAEHYDAWLEDLPADERGLVQKALSDHAWSHADLKPVLENDEDNPAPKFGATAFREWRAGFLA